MSHVRKVIRDQITTAVTGLVTTGLNVYKSRVYPLAQGKLPGICVYTNSESSDYLTISQPRSIERKLSVSVEVYVKGTTNYDDELDQICSEIEVALYTSSSIVAPIRDLQITNFASEYNGDGDQPICAARLSVDVIYLTEEGAPEVGV
jgi:hypothetical protein